MLNPMLRHGSISALLLIGLSSSLTLGQTSIEPITKNLWEDSAPGAKGDEAKDQPRLIRYVVPETESTGVGVVVLPGGGYGGLAMGHEGHEIAQWLNANGISAFICDYRHRGKGYGHPAPMLDAQRAIRTVRTHAATWGVDPNRIGVIGFSRGGTCLQPSRPISTGAMPRRKIRSIASAADLILPSFVIRSSPLMSRLRIGDPSVISSVKIRIPS